jgi:hypothetical protein
VRDGTAAEIVDLALKSKPELIIHAGNLPATAEALRDLFAGSENLFDRGLPVRIIRPVDGGSPSATPLSKHNVVIEAHRLCQPVKLVRKGEHVPVTLPDRVAQIYLDMSASGICRRSPASVRHRCYPQTGACVRLTATTAPPACGAVVSQG